MRRERRLQQKRQRRDKRIHKHRLAGHDPVGSIRLDDLTRLLRSDAVLQNLTAAVPGACHPSLQQPGFVKADYGDWLQRHPHWSIQLREFERRYTLGPLYKVPSINHWALEEFFWHGPPGALTHPLDDWLDSGDTGLPPEAREQLRQWKAARLGVFEVAAVSGETVQLRPCDRHLHRSNEPERTAICLSVLGARGYQGQAGCRLLTYLAPWDRDRQLWCAMGYGLTLPESAKDLLAPLLNLADPEAASAPLPWREHRGSHRKFLAEWKTRDWQAEFARRVQVPFEGVTMLKHGFQRVRVERLVPAPPDVAQRVGIYFETDAEAPLSGLNRFNPLAERTKYVVGASNIEVLDLHSPNARLFAEYIAYREAVGQPPGLVGAPTFIQT